jgi:hypothetical protein
MSEKVYSTNSGGAVKSLVASAGPARLCGFSGYSANASAQFIQVHDAASLPANGSAPKIVFKAGAAANFGADYNANPREFSTGVVVCTSTTYATLTLGATDDCWFDVQLKAGN